MASGPEVWLRGPIAGVPPLLQPVAHALVQAREDVIDLAPRIDPGILWTRRGAASPGFHLLHMAGALDRLFTYARGEMLSDDQRTALRAEADDHPDRDAAALAALVDRTVEAALEQLRGTDPERLLDERRVGRAGLPSTVLGLLFHAAEHTTRHAGQLVSTIRLLVA